MLQIYRSLVMYYYLIDIVQSAYAESSSERTNADMGEYGVNKPAINKDVEKMINNKFDMFGSEFKKYVEAKLTEKEKVNSSSAPAAPAMTPRQQLRQLRMFRGPCMRCSFCLEHRPCPAQLLSQLYEDIKEKKEYTNLKDSEMVLKNLQYYGQLNNIFEWVRTRVQNGGGKYGGCSSSWQLLNNPVLLQFFTELNALLLGLDGSMGNMGYMGYMNPMMGNMGMPGMQGMQYPYMQNMAQPNQTAQSDSQSNQTAPPAANPNVNQFNMPVMPPQYNPYMQNPMMGNIMGNMNNMAGMPMGNMGMSGMMGMPMGNMGMPMNNMGMPGMMYGMNMTDNPLAQLLFNYSQNIIRQPLIPQYPTVQPGVANTAQPGVANTGQPVFDNV